MKKKTQTVDVWVARDNGAIPPHSVTLFTDEPFNTHEELRGIARWQGDDISYISEEPIHVALYEFYLTLLSQNFAYGLKPGQKRMLKVTLTIEEATHD